MPMVKTTYLAGKIDLDGLDANILGTGRHGDSIKGGRLEQTQGSIDWLELREK